MSEDAAWLKLFRILGEFFVRIGKGSYNPSDAASKLQAAMDERLSIVEFEAAGATSALVRAASVLRGSKDSSLLVEALEKRCSEKPDSPRDYLRLGDACFAMEYKEKAMSAYLHALAGYIKQGFYLKAVAVAKHLLKIEPNLISVYRILARLYKQLGLLADAIRTEETIYELAPKLATLVRDGEFMILGEREAETLLKELYPDENGEQES